MSPSEKESAPPAGSFSAFNPNTAPTSDRTLEKVRFVAWVLPIENTGIPPICRASTCRKTLLLPARKMLSTEGSVAVAPQLVFPES
jgi:hypothetical protein